MEEFSKFLNPEINSSKLISSSISLELSVDKSKF